MASPSAPTAVSVFAGRASRSAFRRPWVIGLFFLIAGTYGFASMLVGGMLYFGPTGVKSATVDILTSGNPWWYYPAVFATFPGGSLTLPFFPAIATLLVSIGVGIGMSVAAVIAVRLITLRKAAAGRGLAAGSVAGFAPAVLALVTMGACCGTTAASAAGIGVIAQSTGTTVDTLLVNNWYLGVVQILVVFVALLAQEAILIAYGPLLGLGRGIDQPTPAPTGRPFGRRELVGAGLRVALLVAALLWSLGAVAATFAPGGGLTSAAAWFGFTVVHQLLSALVVAIVLFPWVFHRVFEVSRRAISTSVLRILVVFIGGTLLAWVPPLFASAQTAGIGNILLGALGFPASWGAVAPSTAGPIGIGLELGAGFALLGAFSVALALWPTATLLVLDPRSESSPTVSHPPGDRDGSRRASTGRVAPPSGARAAVPAGLSASESVSPSTILLTMARPGDTPVGHSESDVP